MRFQNLPFTRIEISRYQHVFRITSGYEMFIYILIRHVVCFTIPAICCCSWDEKESNGQHEPTHTYNLWFFTIRHSSLCLQNLPLVVKIFPKKAFVLRELFVKCSLKLSLTGGMFVSHPNTQLLLQYFSTAFNYSTHLRNATLLPRTRRAIRLVHRNSELWKDLYIYFGYLWINKKRKKSCVLGVLV